MLAIRMQRTGRSGHAQFRLIVQDSRFHPTRGKVVAYLGSYDPHQKTAAIDKELAARYLESGAQPSDTAARLLKKEGVKLPDWVSLTPDKQRKVKNLEKMRRNRPAEAAPADTPAETPAETPTEAAKSAEEAPAVTEQAAEKTPVESKPAEEVKAEPEAPTEEAAEPAADEPADSEPAA